MRAGRDILGDYGPNTPANQKARATSGGVTQARDVRNYSPPCGPTNIMDPQGPGLHGHNCGNANRPMMPSRESGSPGLHGVNRGKAGTQR